MQFLSSKRMKYRVDKLNMYSNMLMIRDMKGCVTYGEKKTVIM